MKQVIAMGDGGLDGRNPMMDLYILAQAKKPYPKVCFLGTASGDNEGMYRMFRAVFGRYMCKPDTLALFHPHTPDIKDFIMNQDVIYVGGGQSKSMLGVWREWGLDKIFHEACENGTILAGGSAGSVCWFDQCVTDSIPGSLTVMNCIGVVPYSNCPHYASFERRAAYVRLVGEGALKPGYASDDFAALHFVDGKLHRSISNRPYAKNWHVFVENGKAVQTRLKTQWLGMREYQQEFIFNTPLFKEYQEESEHMDADANKAIVKSDNPKT